MPELLHHIKKEGLDTTDEEARWAQTYENMRVIIEHFPSHIPNNYLEYYLYPNMVVEQSDLNYTRANQIMDGRLKKIDDTVEQIKNNKKVDMNYESSGHG